MMNRSFRLYPCPSFLAGMARILDLGGTLNEYNYYTDPVEADRRAIMSDWEEVGEDFKAAIEQVRKEL